MIAHYYTYGNRGELIPHKYKRGNLEKNIKSTLPKGRYLHVDDKLIMVSTHVSTPQNYGGSDSLGDGVKGVVNPANGKTYDSKSEYRKALKSAGCVEMGTDAKVTERKELRGNYDVSKELSQAIDQTGFMDKIKGKK